MGKLIPQRLVAKTDQDRKLIRPEILAPAGNWECAKAAVENGADAIFFGLDRFNARLRADNFTVENLPELMTYLHLRGVRGYVTFNTLVFPDELEDAADFLHAIISAGVDAAIVQDVGVCRLIRQISLDFPIHASTQMSVTSTAGVEFARKLGAHLVVLARECSIKEMEQIQQEQAQANMSVPLEVFVHGALCVAYSGQCLTSEALGGRSANRGECAQACRLPYELLADGQKVDLGDRRYLLSPQDLSGLEVVPDLIRAGLTSLKIEGRLKAPEYVASVTRVYRNAVDRAFEKLQKELYPDDEAELVTSLRKDHRYELEMSFSRGLYTGWLNGIHNQELAHGRFGKKRGVHIGQIEKIDERKGLVFVFPKAPIKNGDGIVVDQGRPDQQEQGGLVSGIAIEGRLTGLKVFGANFNLRKLRVGDIIWKTSDPELERKLRKSFEDEKPLFRRPVFITVEGKKGTPLSATLTDELGNSVTASSEKELELANKQPLTEEKLRDQFGRLGGTGYELSELINKLEDGLILPVSELNQLRRHLVNLLDEKRSAPRRWEVSDKPVSVAISEEHFAQTPTKPYIIPVVRSEKQLETVLELGYSEIYAESEDPRKYAEWVQMAQTHSTESQLWLIPPRIFKAGEDWILQKLQQASAHGLLARNHEHLRTFKGTRMRGDFSLNVSNGLTAQYLRDAYGLERLTASYDLNNIQLESLLRTAPPHWFEITIHQHMPMFHMEHCVFCAFLSEGKDFRDCGRPCDKHDVKLKDRVGMEHPLKADGGCRNTLYNAKAQTGAEFVQQFIGLGAKAFRVEFLNESAHETRRILEHYEKLLTGELSGTDLWRALRLHNQLGVTRGTMS